LQRASFLHLERRRLLGADLQPEAHPLRRGLLGLDLPSQRVADPYRMLDDHRSRSSVLVAERVGLAFEHLTLLDQYAFVDPNSGDTLALDGIARACVDGQVDRVGNQAAFAGMDVVEESFTGKG